MLQSKNLVYFIACFSMCSAMAMSTPPGSPSKGASKEQKIVFHYPRLPYPPTPNPLDHVVLGGWGQQSSADEEEVEALKKPARKAAKEEEEKKKE